jgi:hypothetical protein
MNEGYRYAVTHDTIYQVSDLVFCLVHACHVARETHESELVAHFHISVLTTF